jgi:hypothetical protein
MTYRSRALLDIAHDAPCFLLLASEGCSRDASVPCHSDMQRHGRGVGHKSEDHFAVPGCPPCHALFTRANLGREGYDETWLRAHERYQTWLWETVKIKVVR